MNVNQIHLPATQSRLIQLVFTITLTLSAGLLFWVQPMFAKMVLPMLGGAPAVWNTSMVFFQASLLTGYAYAHYSTRYLDLRYQSLLHVIVLAFAFLALPISVATGWSPPTSTTPVGWLLALLTVSIGLPFFAVSATAPLLQKWFAHTRHKDASNPYFLYAASNIGSILALLSYPFVIEPYIGLATQGWVWGAAYTGLFALVSVCAFLMWKHFVPNAPEAVPENPASLETDINAGLRFRWVLLSFVPSSLLLSASAHITMDLASVPLLWIIPLVLYLLTFVIVFSKKPILSQHWMVRLHSYVVLLFVVVLYAGKALPLPFTLSFHLLTFFVTAMVCHGELAKRRPTTKHLTEFYLWMSVGGVLGGMFNALVAPMVFDSIAEYPIAIVLACALRPMFKGERRGNWARDIGYPAILAMVVFAVHAFDTLTYFSAKAQVVVVGILAAAAAMVVFGFSPRPLRFTLGVAVLIVSANAVSWHRGSFGSEFITRSFFGVHRVIYDADAGVYNLMHGSTVHGSQAKNRDAWREPLGYYIEGGPVGQLFEMIHENSVPQKVGVVGMGTGAMACYRREQDQWTFFEIDAVILELAHDTRFFNYLNECGGDARTVLGDARRSLDEEPYRYFDLLVIDAFSSDAIPLHLITSEAILLYLDKLTEDGIIAIHISNNFMDLEPVLGNLVDDLKLAARIQMFDPRDEGYAPDQATGQHEKIMQYRLPSRWVALGRTEHALGPITQDSRWKMLKQDPLIGVWTDDYSNIVRVMRR
jgi:hypothetical protein